MKLTKYFMPVRYYIHVMITDISNFVWHALVSTILLRQRWLITATQSRQIFCND